MRCPPASPRLAPATLIAVALLAACAPRPRVAAPTWTPDDAYGPAAERYPAVYADTTSNIYLRELRQAYRLDDVTASAKTDLARVRQVLRWTHQQWSHDGSNVPSKPDALTILAEVAEGKRYRCDEYGIVSRDALASLRIPARVLALKTADVETREWGAGHVAAEAYLRDLGKWVFLDGQFDVTAELDGMPLSALKLAQALRAHPDDVVFVDAVGPDRKRRRGYLRFVTECLYYLEASFDQRPGPRTWEPVTVDG